MAHVATIAVIGCGKTARAIAQAAAIAGYRTILENLLPDALRKAADDTKTYFEKTVALGKLPARVAQDAMSRLEFADSIEDAAREADLVIEAGPEDMESKMEMFILLDKICRPPTILASNGGALSITEIASVTYRPKKCVGMRFLDPVHEMTVLEVVRALQTDEETVAAAVGVGSRMGKKVVLIQETPHSSPPRARDFSHA